MIGCVHFTVRGKAPIGTANQHQYKKIFKNHRILTKVAKIEKNETLNGFQDKLS